MTSFFVWWGTGCARHPVPVMLVSVALALGLLTGVHWLEVQTDPVELWAAPGSRSRVEKQKYDEIFRPFYRTSQVIIHAKNLDEVRIIHTYILAL